MKLTAELNKLSCFTVHCSYSFCTVCCGCDVFLFFLHGGVTQNYFTSPTPGTLNLSNIVLFASLFRCDSLSIFPSTGSVLDLTRTGRNRGTRVFQIEKKKVKMPLFHWQIVKAEHILETIKVEAKVCLGFFLFSSRCVHALDPRATSQFASTVSSFKKLSWFHEHGPWKLVYIVRMINILGRVEDGCPVLLTMTL